jgi:hypothetical protein
VTVAHQHKLASFDCSLGSALNDQSDRIRLQIGDLRYRESSLRGLDTTTARAVHDPILICSRADSLLFQVKSISIRRTTKSSVTSPRKIKANGFNAKASTGPKSACGKARAAQNARSHGLSIPVAYDRALIEVVESLAREIAGANSERILEYARRIAEAQIDIKRIRLARQVMLEQEKVATSGSGLIKQLTALDRYEQRARSRRKFAIRAYDLARQQIMKP